MFVTYKPEDGDTQTWDFNPGRVRVAEAEMVEKRFGGNWNEWCRDVVVGAVKARRVLLWYLLRRTHHTLRYEDTPDFYMDEFVVEHSVAEIAEMRERLNKANLSDEQREQAIAALDIEMSDAMEREAIEPDAAPAGKARSKRGGASTGGR